MTHPGEKFYPEGVHWDDPIARGTLPDLLSNAATQYGARPAIEFRDRPISYAELEAMVEVAASALLRAGYGKNASVALFLGNSPDHPVNFFGALKPGARNSFAQSTDALMLAFTPGGRERTAEEFGVIWDRAGLRCVKQATLPSLGTRYALEPA